MEIPTTQPPAEPITHLNDVRASHNVVAALPSLEAARATIVELERAGVPPGAIALLGAATDDPVARSDGPSAAVGGAAVRGAVAGAAGAGVLGAVTSVAVPGLGPLIAAGLWAVGGAAAGGVVGGVAAAGGSDAWHHTFAAVESGNVAVGVHADDAGVVDLAADVLVAADPLSINRFGTD